MLPALCLLALAACGGRVSGDATEPGTGGGPSGGSTGGGSGSSGSGGGVTSGSSGVACVAEGSDANAIVLRKDFLFGTAAAPDAKWVLNATYLKADAPNSLVGATRVLPVRLQATVDKLQASDATSPDEVVIDAWPATNVELDPRTACTPLINSALDWQDRPWIEILFDKKDASDLGPLLGVSTYAASLQCAETSVDWTASLAPGSLSSVDAPPVFGWQTALDVSPAPTCVPSVGNLLVQFSFHR